MKYYKFSDEMDKQWFYVCVAEDVNGAIEKYKEFYAEYPGPNIVGEEIDFNLVFSMYLKDVGLTRNLKKLILEHLPEIKMMVDSWVEEQSE